jgi:PKD repeat protein
MTASMTYEIPSELVSTAPETIKMWWYDYDAGAWREGGEARREGSRWIGEVSHFSCWNFDVNAPSVVVNGQIISSNGVSSQFYITILNEDGKGGRGSANADGSFSGRVESGVPLNFTIRYLEADCDAIVHQETIGPFDQNMDLGDIVVNTENFPSKPNAMFIATQDDNQILSFSFDNTSSVGGITNSSFTSFWDFGGDGTSTEENPTHTFSIEGFYDITLTITAADGEVDVITQTIQAGGTTNKFASVTDTRDDDTGELRLELEEAILTGGLRFIYRVSEGQEMNILDAFINVAGTSTSGDFSVTEIRIKDNAPHEFREGASDATILAANFPEGAPDVWVPIEINWEGDGITVPTYSVTIGGQSVITDAISTTNGGPGDVDDHLAAVVDGVMNFQWKYNSNSLTSDGVYQIDNIEVYSSNSGTETIVFQDNFEGRLTGENLNPDFNLNSPYHMNSVDATVAEGM